MVVHAGADIAVAFALVFNDEVDTCLDVLGVRPVIGIFPMGKKGHHAETHDPGLASVAVGPVPILGLGPRQVTQPLDVHLVHLGRNRVILPEWQGLAPCPRWRQQQADCGGRDYALHPS